VWRHALTLVACFVALFVTVKAEQPAGAAQPAATPVSCSRLDTAADKATTTQATPGPVTERPGSLFFDRVASWLTGSTASSRPEPNREAPMCATVRLFDLTEIRPGLAVGQTGDTVTVVGDRRAVGFGVDYGGHRHASSIAGEIAVNANWYTARGAQGPIVADGQLGGSADTPERGQLLARRPGCDPDDPGLELEHVWTGEIYDHDLCVVAAVSGVSLVHKGVRADAYPGFDITHGYTNTSRSHSFIGFNETEIVIVATRDLTASQLADYTISLGVTEGVMLDGGGSTQIATPVASLSSTRAVPAFAVLDSIG